MTHHPYSAEPAPATPGSSAPKVVAEGVLSGSGPHPTALTGPWALTDRKDVA